jgi:tetratricopeptide (TPR) repeat protein
MEKPARPFSWNRDWVLGLLLLVVTLVAYRPAWNGKLLWDDDINITSPGLRSLDGLASIWIHPGATVQYYPLVHTVFWLEYHLWGESTLGYHFLNILLHFFSTLLLVSILRKLGIRAAWLAGGIFALHPVMVESVAWITELKNVLSMFFFLAAILAYLRFDRERKKTFLIAALLLFLAGLASKTSIAPLPIVLPIIFWWQRGRLSWKRDMLPLIPFFLVALAYGFITIWVEHRFVGTQGIEFAFSFIDRCLIAGRAFWFYLGTIAWPGNLMFFYPHWNIDAAAWWQYLFPGAALGFAGLLFAIRSRWRTPFAVLGYFVVMLFPVAGFISQYAFRFSFVADHWVYLAAIGPMVIAAAGVSTLSSLSRNIIGVPRGMLPVLIIAILALLTFQQARIYANAETLYRTTIRKNGNCWIAYNNLGVLMAEAGRTDEAVACYRKALEINPDFAKPYANLGNVLAGTGNLDEAAVLIGKALQIDPNYVEAHINLGNIRLQSGRLNEAMAHILKALEIDPGNADAHYNLGILLAKMGQNDEAMVHFLKALEIEPGNGSAHYNVGILLGQMGRTDEAVVHYRKALELNPGNAEAHCNLGILLAQTGRIEEAIAHFRRALEINPDNAEAHNNLGILLAQIGRTDEAIAHYRQALEISPDAIAPLRNLAFALVQQGQWFDANSVLRKALGSVKTSGDDVRAKTIAQILANLGETIDSVRVTTNAHAQR